MKKKILFILNTYDIMTNKNFNNYSIKKIYDYITGSNSYWITEFYKKLKKDYQVVVDYPKINQKYLENKSYIEIINNKIKKLEPDLIYCNLLDINLEKVLKKITNSRKLIWLSVKTSNKRISELKKSYDYIISGNKEIHKLARKNKFKNFELMISSPANKKYSKKNFLCRRKEIYFAGSLGNDFKYRLEVLEYIKKRFATKFRIRNLVERYFFVKIFTNQLLIFFPNFTKYLYEKKILPIFNTLKKFNSEEIFGKTLLSEMEKYQIIINVHSGFDQNNNTNSRVFEALSAGCLLFCEENEFMKKFFIGNKHVVYFNSLKDLENKISFFLNNPKKSFLIARAGNLLFNKLHTSDYRFKEFKGIIKKIIN
tara:strand:- start:262 stop:1365 length:1104 start_codon:yes stop_codon:yes gene_type:complete